MHADYTDAAIAIPDLEIGLVAAENSSTSPVSVNTNTDFTGVPFNLPEVGFDNRRQGEYGLMGHTMQLSPKGYHYPCRVTARGTLWLTCSNMVYSKKSVTITA